MLFARGAITIVIPAIPEPSTFQVLQHRILHILVAAQLLWVLLEQLEQPLSLYSHVVPCVEIDAAKPSFFS